MSKESLFLEILKFCVQDVSLKLQLPSLQRSLMAKRKQDILLLLACSSISRVSLVQPFFPPVGWWVGEMRLGKG